MKTVLFATDAWHPQVNGVVKTASSIRAKLLDGGMDVRMVEPGMFPNLPLVGYPEIRVAIAPHLTWGMLEDSRADHIHVFTEGPIGLATKLYCMARGIRHTSSFHAMYPEYLQSMFGLPVGPAYAYLQWFHSSSAKTMVPTPTLTRNLASKRFSNLVLLPRGVDTSTFRPAKKEAWLPRPIHVYAGRVSVEKNIAAFLSLDLPGSKVVIGDGPWLREATSKHPDVTFLGMLNADELAARLAQADVFVFPSKTDTFGIVIIEALACGLPVVAFDVQGPKDIIVPGTGLLSRDDQEFARNCRIAGSMEWNPESCVRHASQYTWETVTRTFVANLVPTS